MMGVCELIVEANRKILERTLDFEVCGECIWTLWLLWPCFPVSQDIFGHLEHIWAWTDFCKTNKFSLPGLTCLKKAWRKACSLPRSMSALMSLRWTLVASAVHPKGLYAPPHLQIRWNVNCHTQCSTNHHYSFQHTQHQKVSVYKIRVTVSNCDKKLDDKDTDHRVFFSEFGLTKCIF